MAPDPFIKYFKAVKKDLSSLVERYDALFKHDEEFPTLFGKTELFGPRSGRPLSAVLSNLEQALQVHENFQTVNEKYFLMPLERVCAVVPSISSLFNEREDLVKDLDKLKKKQQKMETMERTGENLAKLSKVVAQFESGNVRLSAIDTLIDRDLKELTSRTELFLGRIIKAHLNWKYQSCLATVESNTKLAHLFSEVSRTGDLDALDAEMNNQLSELRSLTLIRPT